MSAALEERPVCRRCKKKRPIDEPLETARYRTCKPCREIERKKKRLKKLELTGREPIAKDMSKYPMVDQHIINLANQVTRATQLPLPNQQYDNLNPPVLAPINYQQQSHHDVQQRMLQHQQAQQQQAQQQAQAAAQAAAHAQHAIIKQKIEDRDIPIDELLLKQDGQSAEDHHDSKLLTQEALDAIAQTERQVEILADKTTDSEENNNLFAALKNAEENEQAENDGNLESLESVDYKDDDDLNVCIFCGSTHNIEDNGRFQVCATCVQNPLDGDNVFDDFSSYLARIALGKVADCKNVVFIKRFEENDADAIADFKQFQDGTNNLEEVIDELNQKFIDQIITSSGLKFTKAASNFSAKSPLKAIKLLFKCKENENPEAEDSESITYISYDIFSKDLSVRFNHKNHKS